MTTNQISFVDENGDTSFTLKLTDKEVETLLDVWKHSCCSFAPIRYSKIDKNDHTEYTAVVKDKKSAEALEAYIKTSVD